MHNTNDGGPAFPQHLIETRDGSVQASYDVADCAGLSLRDYFAAKALQGICASAERWNAIASTFEMRATFSRDAVAVEAYDIADAMLSAREAKR